MPNMKKHVRFHLGYRATCRECCETFSNVGSLRKHTRVAHPEVYRARLVERLEKYGVLRGPDKNALKKKIVDKVISQRNSVKNSVDKIGENNKSEATDSKGDNSEKADKSNIHADNELSFAADEIDDGGSRFKFSCTVCKKRFSSYLNMCRHRRKAHNSETKPKSEQCLTFGHQSRAPSPVIENPEEIAAFYANVSHNIATNLNCFIDGKPESLVNFVDHIKVEDYTGAFGYKETVDVVTDFNWEYYNFPRGFAGRVVDVKGKEKQEIANESNREKVNIREEETQGSDIKPVESDKTTSEVGYHIPESDTISNNQKDDIECVESSKGTNKEDNSHKNSVTSKVGKSEDIKTQIIGKAADNNSQNTSQSIPVPFYQSDTMGIASYGMKMLSQLVQGGRPPTEKVYQPKPEDGAKFFTLRISDGVILKESPAAKTFHQVWLSKSVKKKIFTVSKKSFP